MIPVAVQRLVVLATVASLAAGCALDSQSPEDHWQEIYNKGFVELSDKKLDKAEKTFQSALTIARKIDPKGKRLADSLFGLGEIAVKKSQFDRAIVYLFEAKTIYEKLWNPELGGVNNRDNAIYLAKIMMNYAIALAGAKRLKEAHETIAKAREIAEVAPAPDSVTHDIMVAQANIVKQMGRTEESDKLSRGANDFDDPLDSRNSEHTRNMSWEELVHAGDLARESMNYDGANSMYKKAQKLLEKTGAGGLPLGRLYLSMGALYDAQKDYTQAERMLSKAIRILRVNEVQPVTVDTKYYTSEAMERLAALYLHTNRYDDAREMYQMTIGIEQRLKHGDKYRRRERRLMHSLIDVYKKMGNYKEAERLLKEKLAIELPLYGEKSRKMADGYRALGDICALEGKNQEASSSYEYAIAGYARVKDQNPREKIEVFDAYADHLEKIGQTEKAVAMRKKAEDLETAVIEEFHD